MISNQSYSNESYEPSHSVSPALYHFSTYYQLFIILIGFIGNTITIIIFSRTKQTPRKTSFFLISLAVNDILCLLTILAKVGLQLN